MIEPDPSRESRDFGVRVSLLFAAIFVVAGTNLPFLPVWLDWQGLGPGEIAIITAVPLFVRVVVTPVIAFAADRANDYRLFLIALSWVGLGALVGLSLSSGFWQILACSIVFALAWTTIMPLTETIALTGVKIAGLDYGRMRLWGSLSFIAATLVGGWVVGSLGAASAVWLLVAGGILVTAAAHALARPIGGGRFKAATTGGRLRLAEAAGLLRSPTFLVFLLAAGAVQGAHGSFYSFGTVHWASQGISAGWAGTLWAIAVIAEIILFAYSGLVVARVRPVCLIALGGAVAIVRWFFMGFDPPLEWLLVLQLLHSVTFGATHIGAIHYMSRAVPDGQGGTAQALYASVTGGIALGGAMLISGPLYVMWGGGAYWAMASIAVVGFAAAIWLASQVGPSINPRAETKADG
jgi:MFS transporter, PPP family, 3-phenylpropionic acid transporter